MQNLKKDFILLKRKKCDNISFNKGRLTEWSNVPPWKGGVL